MNVTEFHINAEHLDKFIQDALLKSSLARIINDSINRITLGYDNPIDKALKPIVYEIAYNLIREKFEPQIKELLTEIIEQSVTADMAKQVASAAAKNMVKAMSKLE